MPQNNRLILKVIQTLDNAVSWPELRVLKAHVPLQSPSRCHQGVVQGNTPTMRVLTSIHHWPGSKSQQGFGMGISWRLSVLWQMSTSRPCA